MKMIRLVLVLVMVMLGQLSFAAWSVLAQTAGGDARAYFIGQVVGFIAGLGCVFAFVRWLMRRQKEGGEVRVGGTRLIYTVAILVAVFIVFRYFVGTPLSKSARLAFASGSRSRRIKRMLPISACIAAWTCSGGNRTPL